MSTVNIRHVVVHELLKESNKDFNYSKPYNLRHTELDKNNSIVKELVDGVVKLYGTKGNAANYGVFKSVTVEQNQVPSLFHNYHGVADSVSSDFIKLSKAIMHQMFLAAQEQKWASGGYVVFTDYVLKNLRYLLVTMIKKTNGVTISENLEPEEMMHLELGNINQAARINFHLYYEYQNADDIKKTELSYLSFISKTSGQSAAAYFISALGCDKGIASAGATRKLPNAVRKFFRTKEELIPYAETVRTKIISYLETQMDHERPAKLSDIEVLVGHHINFLNDDTRNTFVSELIQNLNSEDVRIPTEFIINKASLNKLRNVIFKNQSYSFNFDKDLLGTTSDAKIYYDDTTGNLTFSNLPVEAKTKIRQALKEMSQPFMQNDRQIDE